MNEDTPLLHHSPIRLLTLGSHPQKSYLYQLPHPWPASSWITLSEAPPTLSAFLAEYDLPNFPRRPAKHVYYSKIPSDCGPIYVLCTPTLRHISSHSRHITHTTDINLTLEAGSKPDVLTSVLEHILKQFLLRVEALSEQLMRTEQELLASPTILPLERILQLHAEISATRHLYPSLLQAMDDICRVHRLRAPIEAYLSALRGASNGLLEIVLSLQNNRMQETMQTLAVITTMFVPLTFLAGIEGMNFAYMPELRWTGGYVSFWVLVCMIFVAQMVFFKRKGWI